VIGVPRDRVPRDRRSRDKATAVPPVDRPAAPLPWF